MSERPTTSSSSAAGLRGARSRTGSAPIRRPRPRPRGGPLGLQVGRLHPHAGRARDADRQQALRLEVRVGAGAVHERTEDLPRPRQGARRLVEHQRDDLPARQPARLRALGRRAGHGHVGLRALPPVLQADGDVPCGCGRVARWGGAARPRAWPRDEPALPGLLRGRSGGGLSAHRRRQRLPAGGVCGVRSQHPPRPAAQRREGLPPPGHATAESRRALQHLREPRALRGHARGRGRGRRENRAAAESTPAR